MVAYMIMFYQTTKPELWRPREIAGNPRHDPNPFAHLSPAGLHKRRRSGGSISKPVLPDPVARHAVDRRASLRRINVALRSDEPHAYHSSHVGDRSSTWGGLDLAPPTSLPNVRRTAEVECPELPTARI